MYAWLFRGSELVVYPLIALFLFMGVFVSVVIRTYGGGADARFVALADLPLRDDAAARAHSDIARDDAADIARDIGRDTAHDNTGEHHG